ncbi:MAG: hypothetical protein OXG15_07390 [Gammaproteobacteria bacterium]|nr:hypothetical protein [Gammaproteobacteria bacterium]
MVLNILQSLGMDPNWAGVIENEHLNIDFIAGYALHDFRHAITGAQFGFKELQQYIKLFPDSGKSLQSNLISIHSALENANGKIRSAMKEEFGKSLADAVPDFFQIADVRFDSKNQIIRDESGALPESHELNDPRRQTGESTTGTTTTDTTTTDTTTTTETDTTTTTTETTDEKDVTESEERVTAERDVSVESPEITRPTARVTRRGSLRWRPEENPQQISDFASKIIENNPDGTPPTAEQIEERFTDLETRLTERGMLHADAKDTVNAVRAEMQRRADFRSATDPTQIRGRISRERSQTSPPERTQETGLTSSMRNTLKDELRGAEGFRSKPYNDRGQQAIGYGFRMDQWGLEGRESMTEDEAEVMLDRIISTTYNEAKKMFGDSFDGYNESQKMAIMELIYNLGYTRFSEFDDAIEAIKRQDWYNAAKEILNSEAAELLPDRYNRLANMLQSKE